MERTTFNEMVCLEWEEQDMIYAALQNMQRKERVPAQCSDASLVEHLVSVGNDRVATIQKILEKLDVTEHGRDNARQAAEACITHPELSGEPEDHEHRYDDTPAGKREAREICDRIRDRTIPEQAVLHDVVRLLFLLLRPYDLPIS